MHLFVFYSQSEPGWIVRAHVNGSLQPLITSDLCLLHDYFEIATVLSREKNMVIDVYAFEHPELLARIEPSHAGLRVLN